MEIGHYRWLKLTYIYIYIYLDWIANKPPTRTKLSCFKASSHVEIFTFTLKTLLKPHFTQFQFAPSSKFSRQIYPNSITFAETDMQEIFQILINSISWWWCETCTDICIPISGELANILAGNFSLGFVDLTTLFCKRASPMACYFLNYIILNRYNSPES